MLNADEKGMTAGLVERQTSREHQAGPGKTPSLGAEREPEPELAELQDAEAAVVITCS